MQTQQQNAQPKLAVQDKVFSQMVKAGSKTYFFDVKKAINGSHYLTITESYKNKKDEKVINRLLIFKDHFTEFVGAFSEVQKYLQ